MSSSPVTENGCGHKTIIKIALKILTQTKRKLMHVRQPPSPWSSLWPYAVSYRFQLYANTVFGPVICWLHLPISWIYKKFHFQSKRPPVFVIFSSAIHWTIVATTNGHHRVSSPTLSTFRDCSNDLARTDQIPSFLIRRIRRRQKVLKPVWQKLSGLKGECGLLYVCCHGGFYIYVHIHSPRRTCQK